MVRRVKRKRGYRSVGTKRKRYSPKYRPLKRRKITPKRGLSKVSRAKASAAKKVLGIRRRDTTIVRGPHIFPMRMLTQGKYRFGFQTTNPTGKSYAEFQFVLNGIFDPNKTGTGATVSNQPVIDIETAKKVYTHYRVQSATIYFSIRNLHDTENCFVQIRPVYQKGMGDDHEDQSHWTWSTDTSYVSNKGNPGVLTKEVGTAAASQRERLFYRRRFDMRRMAKVAKSTYNQQEAFAAALTNNPTNEMIFDLRAYNPKGLTTAGLVDLWVDGMIIYDVELFESTPAGDNDMSV